MTSWSDLSFEMNRLPLDVDTADRLLAGTVAPEDAPPGYSEVGSLLIAARADDGVGHSRSDDLTMARFVAAVRSTRETTTRSPRRSTLHRAKPIAALVTIALACTTGLALAGTLPGAAQDVASEMLAKVGIEVPGPNDNAGTHPNVRGQSDVSNDASVDANSPEEAGSGSSGKGSEISSLATTTDLEGVDKGAAISTLASGGQSQAGQHGQAGADHRSAGQGQSSDGAATADEASDGHSTAGAANGAATADEASDGHSTAGAANGAAGQSHRP
jgi:hypothetical protein